MLNTQILSFSDVVLKCKYLHNGSNYTNWAKIKLKDNFSHYNSLFHNNVAKMLREFIACVKAYKGHKFRKKSSSL